MTTPELLAPAGNMHSLKSALLAGADAVYIGGEQYSARANAKNFTLPQIGEAVELCHHHGAELYVAVNTLFTDRELEIVVKYCAELYAIGVDAVIVADLGLVALLRQYMPSLPVHISTQAGGHNAEGAKFFAELGAKRMVCARELTEQQISALAASSPIELEVFVHGALCVSVSGQCLLSSFIGGRSGNRGDCAQPCRLPACDKNGGGKTDHILSLRDNCLAPHIPRIIADGVASLKIEGRMKGADYVTSAVSTYRRLLDENRPATNAEVAQMGAVFSRQGFTDGYFTGDMEDMLGRRSPTAQHKGDVSANLHNTQKRPPIHTPDTSRPPLAEMPSYKPPRGPHKTKNRTTARFYDPATIPTDHDFDLVFLPLHRFAEGRGKANGVLLPSFITDDRLREVASQIELAKSLGAKHIMVGNAGHISLAVASGLVVHGDFRLNVTNSLAAQQFEMLDSIILSPELNLAQMRDISAKKSVIVYGRVPMMTLVRPLNLRQSNGWGGVRDRMGKVFPVTGEGGADVMFNSLPIYMADKTKALREAGLNQRHFIFTTETATEVKQIIAAYQQELPPTTLFAEIKRM